VLVETDKAKPESPGLWPAMAVSSDNKERAERGFFPTTRKAFESWSTVPPSPPRATLTPRASFSLSPLWRGQGSEATAGEGPF